MSKHMFSAGRSLEGLRWERRYKRKRSVEPQMAGFVAQENSPPCVGCSSFMPRFVQSAMTTARFVVVDCIYGVDCGPRGCSGSRNWRTDGQLGA